MERFRDTVKPACGLPGSEKEEKSLIPKVRDTVYFIFFASEEITFKEQAQVISISACVLSWFSHVQLFVTPWTVALQALLSVEFSRQEYWSGLPCPPPSQLSCQTCIFLWPADALPRSHLGSPEIDYAYHQIHP